MAKVLIPTPLRQFADKHDAVELTGASVGDVLAALTTRFPDLRKQLFNDEGKLRSFVNVYLNDEDIRYLKKDATPVAASDTLSIVPSIAGGRAGREEKGDRLLCPRPQDSYFARAPKSGQSGLFPFSGAGGV
jgi:molybdopterin converting factor small subunit